jgi:hypothetical protein
MKLCLFVSNRFALLSLVLGFVVNSAFRSSSSPTPTLSIYGNTANDTTAVSPKVSDLNGSVMPLSMRDFALAVFNPGTTSLSVYTKERPAPGHVVSDIPNYDHEQTSGPDKAKPSKDVIQRPVAPSPALLTGGRPLQPPSSKGHLPSQSDLVSSLSVRIADSLSPFFDSHTVVATLENDMRELMDALDKLVFAISRQTAVILQKTAGTAQVLRDSFQYRNARARGKARELRNVGGQIISLAEEQIKMRAGKAKVKAKALRERYLASATWGARAHAHMMSKRMSGTNWKQTKLGRRAKQGARKLFCGGF